MSQMTEAENQAGAATPEQKPGARLAKLTMGMWGFYFVAKLALYWLGLIGFHVWENLAFVAFILVPVSHMHARRAKLLVTAVLAVALLYYDSWLPGIDRVFSQASLVSGFSATYLIELAGRFVSFPVVALLLVAGGLYWAASRWIRLDALVIAAILATGAAMIYRSQAPEDTGKHAQFTDEQTDWYDQAVQSESAVQPTPEVQTAQPAMAPQSTGVVAKKPEPAEQATESVPPAPVQPAASTPPATESSGGEGVPEMDKVLEKFYALEAARSVSFPSPDPADPPFDVIFIHICSLSWDDLKVTGLEQHPLLRRFDILLTQFNSASTYSGPSVIRMQRATCGQTSHNALYSPVADKCYLMGSLKRAGFEPSLVLNHDGHFDNFLKLVQAQGMARVAPMPLNGVTINQHAFDDTPIYEDISVLSRWIETRQKSAAPRVAMFYNTVSLHDGNHLSGPNAGLNSQENFKIRLSKMLDDLDKFLQDLEKSGRRAVVAMVPEHGAALRGDRMQIAGLREIPTPAITLVPVGIKVIGGNAKRSGDTVRIGKPTSYLAVSHIVARMLEKSPYAKGSFAPADYVAGLPVTPFVSQNDGAVMLGFRGRYYLRQGDAEWIDYTDF